MLLRTFLSTIILLICLNHSHQVEFFPDRSDYIDALEGIHALGIRLQTLLNDPNSNKSENFIISPLSAAMVIGQLMLGADSDYKEILYQLISLPRPSNQIGGEHISFGALHQQMNHLLRDLKKNPNISRDFTLEMANALFVNSDIALHPQFVHEARLLYESDITRINFRRSWESMAYINNWASQHTRGLINNILAYPPGPSTASIFANAIYFLGEWEQPFSSELNVEGSFHTTKDDSVETTFMTGFLEQIPYAESKLGNWKVISLPYKNRELGFYIVMPNKGHEHEFNINKFFKHLKFPEFKRVLQKLENKDAIVKIPKLSLSTSVSFLKPLQKYAAYKKAKIDAERTANIYQHIATGVNKYAQFNETEEGDIILSEAALNTNFRISEILQQITFSLNEKGTEVAAISAGIMDYSGGSKTFVANKPFMFFIRHEPTTVPLFWGTISNPKA